MNCNEYYTLKHAELEIVLTLKNQQRTVNPSSDKFKQCTVYFNITKLVGVFRDQFSK